ncbi:MAG: hypothetical protein V3R58_03640, partial [candidate division NC10 bacterium]
RPSAGEYGVDGPGGEEGLEKSVGGDLAKSPGRRQEEERGLFLRDGSGAGLQTARLLQVGSPPLPGGSFVLA